MPEMAQSLRSEQTAADRPIGFLSLAGELRNKIYELALTQEENIEPWQVVIFHKAEFTSGLLRACKTVHREASPVFYGRNRFDFSDSAPERVRSFLDQIGKTNASYIRDITIDFPDVLCLDGNEVSLEDGAVSILEAIRDACPNLCTITTTRNSTTSVENHLDSLDNLKLASEALALVDARFRSITSIQEIIVEVYEDAPSGHIRKTMEHHGWETKAMGYEEEDEWGGPISDFYSDEDYLYDSDGDDYDIDHDSDFWRRAAD